MDESGLPTGAHAHQCNNREVIDPPIPEIRSLLCNFTLFTTYWNIILQYGVTVYDNSKSNGTVLESRFGAPATFFSLDDSFICAYSLTIPKSDNEAGGVTDASYKLSLLAGRIPLPKGDYRSTCPRYSHGQTPFLALLGLSTSGLGLSTTSASLSSMRTIHSSQS